MHSTTVLYEPLPIARIGVRLADERVYVGTDFSTFAYMLEEFVSLGVCKIAVPQTSPEASALAEMPKLLRQRVCVLDDSNEVESVARILFPIWRELGVEIDSASGRRNVPKKVQPALYGIINRVDHDTRCLALGLNHSLQIDIDPVSSKSALSASAKPCTIRTLEQLLRNLRHF